MLNLVLAEIGDAVDDDPGKRAAEVDGFVHHKGHDASGEDVVLHVCVPGHPEALGVVEGDIGLGDGVEGIPVGIGQVAPGKAREKSGRIPTGALR